MLLYIKPLSLTEERDRLGATNPGFNFAVNGDLQSAQAGTSFTAAGQIVEMWRIWSLGTSGAATVTRQIFALGQTDVPNNPIAFLRWVQTTAATGGTRPFLSFTIEDAKVLAEQWMTITFYVRSTANIDVNFFVRRSYGTGGSPSADQDTTNQSYAITPAWTKIVYTVQMPTVSGKVFGSDGNSCLRLFWALPTAINFTFEICELKVEVGQVSTPMQRTDDLYRVHRYYQTVRPTARFVAAAGAHFMEVQYPLYRPMRANPAVTLISGGQRLNMATNYPAVANQTNVGGRFIIYSAAAGDCYAIFDNLLLDARL